MTWTRRFRSSNRWRRPAGPRRKRRRPTGSSRSSGRSRNLQPGDSDEGIPWTAGGGADLFVGCGVVVGAGETGERGGNETGPYDVVANWPQNYCGAGQISSDPLAASGRRRRIACSVFSRGCLPELKETRGAADSFIPSRNASGYDLSQTDATRHPRWDHIVNIVDRDGKLRRVVGTAQQAVRPSAPRADEPLRRGEAHLARRRWGADDLASSPTTARSSSCRWASSR